MFFTGDALMGAGVGFAGGLINNLFAGQRQEQQQEFNAQQALQAMQFSRQSSQEAMRFNQAEASAQRDWTERMSSSAYQRTMNDMKQAGMNPILAYRQGSTPSGSGSTASGAPSPGGTAASSSLTPVHDMIQPALSTAMQMQRIANETRIADAEVAQKSAMTETEKVRPENVRAHTASEETRYQHLKERLPEAKAAGGKGQIEADLWGSTAGKIAHTAGLIGGSTAKAISPITDAIGTFKSRWPSRQTTETTTQNYKDGSSTFREHRNY